MKNKTQIKKRKEVKKETPVALKIISIFFYIGAAVALIFGIWCITGHLILVQKGLLYESMNYDSPISSLLTTSLFSGLGVIFVSEKIFVPMFNGLLPTVDVTMTEYVNMIKENSPLLVNNLIVHSIIDLLVFIGIAALFFFVARGLYKEKKWARITAIIIAIIGFLFNSFFSIGFFGLVFYTLLGLIINALIIGYLLFDKKIKEAFK